MTYFKHFIASAILATTLFAGQDLESAKIRIKDKAVSYTHLTLPTKA